MKTLLTITCTLLFVLTTFGATIKLTDYGAVPNDNISDCDAFQSAIDEVYTRGAGTIEFPSGNTLLQCNKVFNLARHGQANKIRLTLTGSADSVVEIDMDQNLVSIHAGNMNVFRVENLTFQGADPNDNGSDITDITNVVNGQNVWDRHTRSLFYMTSMRQIFFENVKFLGLASTEPIIWMYQGHLKMENVYFGGSASPTGFVKTQIGSLTIKDVQFVDWSDIAGKRFSLSPWIFTERAIHHAATTENTQPFFNRAVVLENIDIDEGSRRGIVIENNTSARLKNITMNLPPSPTFNAAVEFHNVKDAEIDFLRVGWKSGTAVKAFNNSNVKAKTVIRKQGLNIVESLTDSTSTFTCTGCFEQP